MKLQNKKALVLGAGKSGIASAKFLAKNGAIVALHDKKPIAEWSDEARSLKTENIGSDESQTIAALCGISRVTDVPHN